MLLSPPVFDSAPLLLLLLMEVLVPLDDPCSPLFAPYRSKLPPTGVAVSEVEAGVGESVPGLHIDGSWVLIKLAKYKSNSRTETLM